MPKNPSMVAPVPIDAIKKKVLNYQKLMQSAFKAHNATCSLSNKIDSDHQYMQFYIDKPAMLRLLQICLEAECDNLGVFFGLDETRNNKVTACFLALNKEKEIIQAHFGKTLDKKGKLVDRPVLLGEENWPPPPINENKKGKGHRPYFRVSSDPKELEAYFTAPVKKKSTKKK